MIEPIMYAGIGFLVASLLVIGFIPLVHQRAVRLTMKRLDAVTPMSMAEIQADKDQLRAEFAMSTRRLEMSVEEMKTKTTGQLADIGKKSQAIGRLKLELDEKTAALLALEAREKDLTQELAATRERLADTATVLADTEATLAALQSDFGKVTVNFNETSLTSDSQRVELVAMRAQCEVLKGQIHSYEKETRELRERIARDAAAAVATAQQLTQEFAKSETLTARVAQLEGELVAQTTEAEIFGRRVEELLARLDEQSRFLAEREYSSDQLRGETAMAQQREADIRASLAEAESRRKAAIEGLHTEKSQLEAQLRQSQDERARLQREIELMKREAENAWASERMENAVMRERINDVAAEVARLTSVLEGPGSPIDTILTTDGRSHAATKGNGNGFGALAANEDGKGTLADRIRALQSRSSRLAEPSTA
jgi:DNA repair exonuclease SbcCD ATPase subunit